MVIRCDNEVPGTNQLRSQVGEDDEGGGRRLQSIPVSSGKTGTEYRYKGEVITVYIGNKIVYCGDCVNDAVDRICDPGGIDCELWLI